MSDDRFRDLGGGHPPGEDRRTVGERLEERDRTHPEPDAKPPERPRPTSRYAWLVGIVLFMGIAVLLFTTAIPNQGAGLRGPSPKSTLPAFAAPSATSGLEFDASLCQKRPCPTPDRTGSKPACEVRGRQIVNLCELRRKPLVLTFVFDRAADCFPQVDRVQRAMRTMKGVNFGVVLFSRKDPVEVRKIVERRGWTMPVAVDRDGAVVNLYGVGGCPTTVFAYEGGKVRRTALGPLTEAQLRERAQLLTQPPKS